MADSSSMRQKDMASLASIEYSTPKRQTQFRICMQVAIEVTIVTAVILLTDAFLDSLATGAYHGLDFIFRVLLMLLVIVAGTLVAILTSLWRSRTVRNGVISLEFPVRRISGGLDRVIDFDNVVDVGSDAETADSFGVDLLLRDGTKISLDQDGFGIDGYRILDSICKAFGKSYEGEIKKALLAGTRYQFEVTRLRKVENRTLMLEKPIRTASKKETKKIPLDRIRKVERVTTHYSGEGYLVWLTDGSSFILRKGEVEATGLTNMVSWSSKLAESDTATSPQRSRQSAD